MSTITDILVLTSLLDTPPCTAAVDSLNAWLVSEHGPANTLKRVDEACEGGKAMQAGVWGTAVNYLNRDGLLAAFRAAEWEDRDSVQMLLKEEHDDVFTVYTPGRPPATSPVPKF